MCGIAGIFKFDGTPIHRPTLKAMCDVIAHRGPDDARFLFGGHYGYDYHRHTIDLQEERPATIGLGHRRLSIIDIAHGHQPMSNEDQMVWIAYNGEIFNHQNLRQQLMAHGHQFDNQSDTEVIIHHYEEKGAQAALDLNGQFAYAIWDRRDQSLLLVRDRFGIKPLYYTQHNGALYFASEIKALLQAPIPRKLNYQALTEHFTFQNTYGDKTFIEGVHLLPAGTWLKIDAEGNITTDTYWDLDYSATDTRSESVLQAELQDHLETAVKRQLMSEVPVGAHLSGGMDSGSIAALASLNIPHLQTFNCGFEIPQGADQYEVHFDESHYAQLIADQLDVQHHHIKLGHRDNFPVMAQVAWHLDEPRVGISYQNYLLSQYIKGKATVVLGGAGGDELYAGYVWRYNAISDAKTRADFATRYYDLWTRFLSDDAKRDWFFSADTVKHIGDFSTYHDSFLPIANQATGHDPLSWALYVDTKTFLQGLLVVSDKLGMSASLEERVPLLDHDLVDFTLRLPSEWKLRNGQGKYMLRQVMQQFVPDEIATARKQGFTPPDATWYRTALKQDVENLLLNERTLDRNIFRPTGIQRILDEHMSNQHNHRFLLWSLMIFEWWNRLFIDGDALPSS